MMSSPLLFLPCLVCLLPCFTAALVGQDGNLQASHLSQGVLSSSYEGPPPPTVQHFDSNHYDSAPKQLQPQQQQQQQQLQQPLPQSFSQPSSHQFGYQQYQPTYYDQAGWNGQSNDGALGGWLDKGIKILADVIPVAASVILILTILTSLGLVNVPFLNTVTEAREHLGRALSNIDVDQLANTVNLALHKYRQLFPDNQ